MRLGNGAEVSPAPEGSDRARAATGSDRGVYGAGGTRLRERRSWPTGRRGTPTRRNYVL